MMRATWLNLERGARDESTALNTFHTSCPTCTASPRALAEAIRSTKPTAEEATASKSRRSASFRGSHPGIQVT